MSEASKKPPSSKKKTAKKKPAAMVELESIEVPLSGIPHMRRFYMMRMEDESGVSGVGIILEGVEFSNGKTAITWHSHMGVVGVYDSVKVVQLLHGHEGKTEIKWIDEEEP